MNKSVQKPDYQAPRTAWTNLYVEMGLCQSTPMSTSLEDMGETDYEWEI